EARSHLAVVDNARQQIEKPTLNASEGREIPCQPSRNSSNNLTKNFIAGSSTTPNSGRAYRIYEAPSVRMIANFVHYNDHASISMAENSSGGKTIRREG